MTCSPRTGTSTNGAASDTHDLPVRGSKKQSLADGSDPSAFGLISYPYLPSTTTWIWQDRTLFGCLPEQFRSLLVRPWDTAPVEVHHTEIVLGIGYTFIRQLGEDTGCLGEDLSTPFPKRYAHALSNLALNKSFINHRVPGRIQEPNIRRTYVDAYLLHHPYIPTSQSNGQRSYYPVIAS